MKVCNKCGATLNDQDAFCANCGNTMASGYPVYNQPMVKESISVGGWIGRTLIPMIPLVGGIVYLIMLFIWSGDTKKEDSFRNFAKAQLIVMAVTLVLVIIFGVIFGVTFSEMMNSY